MSSNELINAMVVKTRLSNHEYQTMQTILETGDDYNSISDFVRAAIIDKINMMGCYDLPNNITLRKCRKVTTHQIANLLKQTKRPMNAYEIKKTLYPQKEITVKNVASSCQTLVNHGIVIADGLHEYTVMTNNGEYTRKFQHYKLAEKQQPKQKTIVLSTGQMRIYIELLKIPEKWSLADISHVDEVVLRRNKRNLSFLKNTIATLSKHGLLVRYDTKFIAIHPENTIVRSIRGIMKY